MLDSFGWSDQYGGHVQNFDENVREIADWIFGEGKHVDLGVIRTLARAERGVLGLFDALVFRLYCSADRGGSAFNLQLALARHSGPNAPTSGLTTEIAKEQMRAVSQCVFRIFDAEYIQKNINLFDRIDALGLPEFAANFRVFIEKNTDPNDRERHIEVLRSRVKAFVVYQLTNSLISMGVGCGYYDPTGIEDRQGIRMAMNKYLFAVCFSPVLSKRNYEHFVDYFLMNFVNSFGLGAEREFTPSIDQISTVLDSELLADYWRQNGSAIKDLDLIAKDKVVYTDNYSVAYAKELAGVYAVLDAAILKMPTAAGALA